MSKFNSNQTTPMKQVRYRYVPVQQTRQTEDGESYVTYGISARTVEEELGFVSDVSTEWEEIRRLTDLCTEQQLSPEHLADVIEDFLAEGTLSLT